METDVEGGYRQFLGDSGGRISLMAASKL